MVLDPETRLTDLDDDSLTENTRAAYPVTHIENSIREGLGGHPQNIFMLTCDAFGILPPLSRLTPDQAMYHFLSGYTAKVAGTEKGMGKEPQATFSTCFGAPFMTLHPTVYADLLGKKMAQHQAACWLVNTGWLGGAYGVGERIKIAYTRAMVSAALRGQLAGVKFVPDPVFGVEVPTECPDVPAELLQPRNLWKDKAVYDAKARELAERFAGNFNQFADVAANVRTAGPRAEGGAAARAA